VAVKVLFAWWEYYLPQIMWTEKLEPLQVDPHVFDIEWAYKCSTAPTVPPPLGPANLPAQFVIEPPQQIWGVPGVTGGFWMPGPLYFGGVAPPGVIPPLAQAMLNGSLWTKYKWYADFLGISPSDFNAACIASYFHIPYTPVATTTTTTTTTTTAITTTAVSTVTTTATMTSTVTSTVVSTTTAVSTVTVTKTVVSTALIAGIVVIVIVIAAVAAIIAMRKR
jgi:peptide/nickel transport system substrate-binding protein